LKLTRFLYRVTKGLYDIFATYLLAFLLPFIVFSYGLNLGIGALAAQLDYDTTAHMWASWASTTRLNEWVLRLAITLPIHVGFWWLISRPFKRVLAGVEWLFDKTHQGFEWVVKHLPALRHPVEIGFSIVVTLLLIPFVIQPTLVPGWGPSSWGQRAANLQDGTAIHALQESVVGLYRQLYAQPVVPQTGIGADAVDDAVRITELSELTEPVVPPIPMGENPMMDRWDSLILENAGNDLDRFATIKAFMWVESAGRQFAVSHTGCSGLMQFCAPTARSGPFKDVFGVGQVYTCGCLKKDCRIPRDVQRDLESGIRERIEMHAGSFPCKLTDARFDPARSIKAGALYVDSLHNSFGGNIYLMYIGYNSGPKVAERAFNALGRNGQASLEEIAQVLPAAMQPTYGPGSDARARSLVRTHLPKLANAKAKYLMSVEPDSAGASEVF